MYENNNGYVGYGISPYQMQNIQNRMSGQAVNPYQPYQGYQQSPGALQQMIKGRPVSSYEEANASMIDMDGTLHVFTDVANGRIYTKQLSLDGKVEFKVYVLEEPEETIQTKQSNKTQKQDFVSRKEFNNVVKQLNKKIDELSVMEVSENESNADVK